MFVSDGVPVPGRYEHVCARLAELMTPDTLLEVSEDVYQRQSTLLRVGPLGDTAGLSKLVRVQATAPIHRASTMTIPLRWEATGWAGSLFPVLDADLTVTAEGSGCRLELVGSYRPPWGRPGAVLDKVLLGRVATATVRALIEDLAARIEQEGDSGPDPDPGERGAWVDNPPVQGV